MTSSTRGARYCPICGEWMDDPVCPADGVQTVEGSALDEEPSAMVNGTVVADRYRIDRKLGAGAMGKVYVATQLSMRRSVALKVMNAQGLDSTVLRRFYREAQSLSQLKHPNIVGVHDFGVDERRRMPFLAMELIEGRTLRKVIKAEAPLEPRRALLLLEQIARALVAAHRAGIVHRDLKPDNIMVGVLPDGEEHVTVLDFGIAKPVEALGGRDDQLTASGVIIGTPRYMSPEQVSGQPTGPSADLYSLGCILHELLTAKPPFTSQGAMGMLVQHLHAARPSLPETVRGQPLSLAVRALHASLLEVVPEQRPASAQVVARYLKRLAAGLDLGEPAEVLRASEDQLPRTPASVAPSTDAPMPPPSTSNGPSSSTDAGPSASDLPARRGRIPGAWVILWGGAAALLLLGSRWFITSTTPLRVSAVPVAAEAAEVDAGVTRSGLAVAPDPEARPASRRLRVSSRPPGARVILEDQELGRTPLEIDVPEVSSSLKLVLEGREPVSVALEVGERGPLNVELPPRRRRRPKRAPRVPLAPR